MNQIKYKVCIYEAVRWTPSVLVQTTFFGDNKAASEFVYEFNLNSDGNGQLAFGPYRAEVPGALDIDLSRND
jgi:hypothetical protein